MTIPSLLIATIPLTAAFSPAINYIAALSSPAHSSASSLQMESAIPAPSKPIHDPLHLYPANSPERASGLLEPPESPVSENENVFDPLRLYPDRSPEVSSGAEMSPRSLPLPGDRGFDPFNFAANAGALQWQREAELKHARIAMLAAVGWPLAEMFHGDIAALLGLPNLLASGDRVPSILTEGLSHAPFPAFWIVAVAMAAAIEIRESVNDDLSVRINPSKTRFDRFNPYDKQTHFMLEAELFNGRMGMLAITGYAVQEWFLQSSVVSQVPMFFEPVDLTLGHMANL